MRRIGVLTSGGDAPGMNAAIRAVTRTGIAAGLEVVGIRRGFAGLIAGDQIVLTSRSVSGIIDRGGTMLGSARCPEFTTEDGQRRALDAIRAAALDALIVIGGNGSQAGAFTLDKLGVPVVGVASTIDNDLEGSDITIGVDTALNVALGAIDRIKTTAASHRRAFLVEVMGRDCGYLALMTGIAGGAEVVAIPEQACDPEAMAAQFRAAYDGGKAHAIGVIAEGAKFRAADIVEYFRAHHERIGFDLRVTCLGHIQRGGAPGAFDRLLATRLGAGAVDALSRGAHGVLVGLVRGDVAATPLSEVVASCKPLDMRLWELAKVLAR
ncbi:MAG: ATP-dependent 6-phosphofructokinase [Nitrospirota bacterium]